MREHVRGNGRYFRTEAGALTLDWGSNGSDCNELDFSYVARGKGGNLRKIYGSVRRNDDKETYDTYDVMAGRSRMKTHGNVSIKKAIEAHVREETGEEVRLEGFKEKMPLVPDTIREAIRTAIRVGIARWDFLWRGNLAEMEEASRGKMIEDFIREVWDCGKFYCDEKEGKPMVEAAGLLNVDLSERGVLYKMWRAKCEESWS